MWVIPSHNRIKRLGELIESMGPLDRKQPIAVVICSRDEAFDDYFKMKLPSGWILMVADGDYTYCGEKMNFALEHLPDARFYGHITDDILMNEPDRLSELSEAAGDWKVSFPDDGAHAPRLICFGCCGGKLLRTIGWWAHPALKHNCIDSVIDDIAKHLNLAVPMMDIKFIVKHPCRGNAESDETYARVRDININAGHVYRECWINHPMREETFQRIREAMEKA